jgi:ATPase subunit of ABC transporter with duplicated ATPase domains
VGSIAVSKLAWKLPGGDELFRDVGFRVGNGDRVALVGANGVGKSTLLKLITGDLDASEGTISVDGELGVMHQLVGTADHPATNVRELLVSIAPRRLRDAAQRMEAAERRLADDPMAYADALAAWGDAGGYDLEVTWDECVTRAVGESFDNVATRPLRTFSGGEQKRLALEALLRSEFDILVLDEPDNFLDVPAKRWLEAQLDDTRKTVLFISHDRELLAATATKIVTIEAWGAWTHGGSFADYAEAKARHDDRREHDRALYDDERKRLEDYVKLMRERAKISEAFAPKLKAAETKLRHFVEKNDRPPEVRDQRLDVRLRGARTGKRAVICEGLEIAGLTDPFDLELWYGERVAVLGGNGVGKSHFLRLLNEVDLDADRRRRCGRWTTRVCAGSAQASCPVCSTRRTSIPSGPVARWSRSCTPTTSCSARRWGCCAATNSTAADSRPSRRSRAASRPGSRSCCWSCPARRCCCWTSRPTTSTSCRPRPSRPVSPSSTAPSSRSPTTAGSSAASTATSCSATTARSATTHTLPAAWE